VDSEGTLFKCYLDLGDKEKAVGKISNNGVFDIDFYKLNRWLGFDPFSIQECLKCRVLPLCLGGCDNRREKNLLKESNAGCNVLKLNLEECIKRC
jgi:uncharacterized protein